MGCIIIVDLNLQRINQEARRRQRSEAATGECAGQAAREEWEN